MAMSSSLQRDVESNFRVAAHHDDSPEALVRNDTLWINCLRTFLIGILLVVAVGLTAGTYKVLAAMEIDKYQIEFGRISGQISYSFLSDFRSKIWTARIAEYALNNVSADNGDFLDLNRAMLDDFSSGAQAVTSVWDRIQWSPLLWTQSDRQQWEAYALQKMGENNTDADAVCYVCGEGMEVGSPTTMVTVPGAGSYPCGNVQLAGLDGLVPRIACPLATVSVQAVCQCRPGTKAVENNVTVSNHIFRVKDGKRIIDNGPYPMSPVWDASPPPPSESLLFNQMNDYISRQAMMSMIKTKLPTFAATRYPDNYYATLLKTVSKTPKCNIYYPVFGKGPNNNTIIGSIALDFTWQYALEHAGSLPLGSHGVFLVVESNQGQQFTFQVAENRGLTFVGQGDLHEKSYDSMLVQTTFDVMRVLIAEAAPKKADADNESSDTSTVYKLRIYPSASFESQFVTHLPAILASIVASIFAFTSVVFWMFDILVRRRQIKVMQSAVQTNDIVASLFPDFIKSRLLANTQNKGVNGAANRFHLAAPKQQIRNMLGRKADTTNVAFDESEPIADFFPNVTVVFADIAGFTAWSSEREPTQVFQLLESVYQTFDKIAEKHGVFKVETIGDCYVAVTGLPDVQSDHAVRMARFAHEIMLHMHESALMLESSLGPGTASLSIRVGLHSGSVTGGVLRGDKARFQLFGDTMNTAARMQSTGVINRVQVSQTTAELLIEAGCKQWLDKRDHKINVKGKGEMQTFWVDLTCSEADDQQATVISEPRSVLGGSMHGSSETRVSRVHTSEDSLDRLVDWNADLLGRFLKNVEAGRTQTNRRSQQQRRRSSHFGSLASSTTRPVDEVAETIVMSEFCGQTAVEQVVPESIDLGETVRAQLRQYVYRIASLYRSNPFHNFEHASHVVMSASKIVKRIVRPEDADYSQENVKKKDRRKAVAQQIHQSTFGISSDALMQFAVVFSAVIHDVDHTGVSNAQLVKEEDQLALQYDNKCVAEQNSVQIAWDLLMDEQFSDLRACIYTCDEQMHRFRQLIVNAVIATDIADRDLQMLRKNRWNKAFAPDANTEIAGECTSSKATVVFEYIIQASDVAHTMQHWHIYNRWNERLFEERYKAWLMGREEKDPSVGWYNGEIWFFDNYIIPLARKLETCGVFGVSSDEYLNYALENRHEWELKGREIVQNLIDKYKSKLDAVV